MYGNLPRSSRDRVITIQFHPSQEYFGVQAADKSVELFRVREHDEIRKKMQRRKRRQKEKGKEVTETSDEIQVEDEFTPHVIVRTPVKVRSFDFAPITDVKKAGQIQFVASLINNTIDVYSAPLPAKKTANEDQPEPVRMHSLDLQGHRGDIRSLALSSDDELLASASNSKYHKGDYRPVFYRISFYLPNPVKRFIEGLERQDSILHPFFGMWFCIMLCILTW
jgi:U3 small nucleolar RNA-associated protein 12